MNTAHSRRLHKRWWWLTLIIVLLLAGCNGGGSNTPLAPFVAPPAPSAGQTPLNPFYVVTDNYFYKYDKNTAPFSSSAQFASGNYPVPVAYQADVPPPDGFVLSAEGERSIQMWAQADPRVSVVSGTPASQARITIDLVNAITYNNISNIIGLTKTVGGSGDPRFLVYVTTVDPITKTPMLNIDIAKTLTHELGHAFGLGHSADVHDLMYFQANDQQGQTPKAFLTLGDAMAVWTTLSNRRVNWVADRPTITPMTTATPLTTTRGMARVTDTGGEVVCVYTK